MTEVVRIRYRIAALWLTLTLGAAAGAHSSSLPVSDVSCEAFQEIEEPFTSSVLEVAPWGMKTPNGGLEGLLHNFFVEFSRRTGIPHTGYVAPYARVIHSVQSGQVDFSILHDAPYDGVIRIADALTMEVLLVGRAPALPVLSLKELIGSRVGHIRTSKYGAEFESADYLNKFAITDMKQGLAMLMQDRLDVTASVDRTLYWAMHHLDVVPEKISLLYSLGEGAPPGFIFPVNQNIKRWCPAYNIQWLL